MRTDEILDTCPEKPSIPDYEKLIDDVLQWCSNLKVAFFRICPILSHCNKAGMVFSPPKFQFAREEVEFAGILISNDGLRPTKKYIEAIETFPTQRNMSDVRSRFGLINQVAYCYAGSRVMDPFRHLLKNKFIWDDAIEEAFVASKKEIVRLVKDGMFSFDPELKTCLSPDYSKAGMGWILQQKTCRCKEITPICCKTGWRLVLAGEKLCNPAETRYSPTEGEATACVEGLRDTKYYTLGCKDLYVATDHKPLSEF